MRNDPRIGTTSTIRAFHEGELTIRIADKQKQGYELVDQGYEGKRLDGSRWWARMRYIGVKHVRLPMPMRKTYPFVDEGHDWMSTQCPECQQDCWENETMQQMKTQHPGLQFVCTDCLHPATEKQSG